jgi:DHA3 family macrolide efflux protein-like MFS transporter
MSNPKTNPNPPPSHWKPPFFTMWSGQAVSLLGSQLVQFALVWWLTQTTGSATVLAVATLVALLPQVFIGPLAGVLVDRWNRRRVMMVADALIALATLVLAALFWLGIAQIWHVYLLMFIRAVLGGFHWPAMQASTSLMVPKEQLSRVQGLNQMLHGAMNIFAAPMGALLLSLLSMQGVLAIDIVTALIAVLTLLFIFVPQPTRSPASAADQAPASMRRELSEGFRYVWAWPGLMLIMLMATLINLVLTPTGSLQPILVTRHFSGQAIHLAWMESAWGIGVVVGGITLGAWGGFRKRIVTSMVGLVAMGLSVLLVGFVPPTAFWLAVGLMLVAGFMNPIVNGPLLAVVQAVVAPEMQGRVFTLIMSFASAMSPLGLILAGPFADRFGVQAWFVVGGVVTMLLGAVAFFVPAIMHIEDERGSKAETPGSEPEEISSRHAPGLAEISGD